MEKCKSFFLFILKIKYKKINQTKQNHTHTFPHINRNIFILYSTTTVRKKATANKKKKKKKEFKTFHFRPCAKKKKNPTENMFSSLKACAELNKKTTTCTE